jgi:hypothetical protein
MVESHSINSKLAWNKYVPMVHSAASQRRKGKTRRKKRKSCFLFGREGGCICKMLEA